MDGLQLQIPRERYFLRSCEDGIHCSPFATLRFSPEHPPNSKTSAHLNTTNGDGHSASKVNLSLERDIELSHAPSMFHFRLNLAENMAKRRKTKNTKSQPKSVESSLVTLVIFPFDVTIR